MTDAGSSAAMHSDRRRLLPAQASPGITTWTLGVTRISVGDRSPLPAARDPGQADDDYALAMSVQGEWYARIGIRKLRVLPKQVVMLDQACSWAIEWPSGEQIVILMPRSIVHSLCAGTQRMHGSVLRTPSGGMLSDHILSLIEELPALAERDAAAVEWALLNLVASAVSGIARNSIAPRTPLVDTSLVAALVRRHIEENLTDPELSVASLCERLGLSKTSVALAFGTPARVAGHIRDRRLAVAREMIAGSVVAPDPADLARIFCFRDGEQFERAFARYVGGASAPARPTIS